jgi:Protein of unknown function (DUF3500)
MRRFTHPRVAMAATLLVVWWTGVELTSQRATSARAAAAMTTAATRWLEGLTPEQRTQASFPANGDEITRWNFIPTNMFPRKGVPIKEMTEAQRKLAHDLLKAGLSQRGYLTATSIMDLETILHAIENSGGRKGANVRDPELYFFSVFGTPSAKAAWGWRVEGHHVSLHFAIANNTAVASTPQFFGSNPAEVREEGPKKGLRVLGPMEDAARALLDSLDETQKPNAIINNVAPNEIVTTTTVKIDPLSPVGIAGAALKPAQRDLLTKLIEAYASQMPDDVAAERLANIKAAGLEKVTFAWAGETEKGKKHYYRVQGPTFLIEYDNSQNDGNHIHSVWRDFAGDFGRDLLREHVTGVPH